MIRFTHVSKRYPNGHEALTRVSFHLAKGEMLFLTGHSGAGKSTVLKLIALLESSTQGQIHINDQSIHQLSRRHIPYLRRTMGVIFQNPQLLYERTVFDNVALPLVISGYHPSDIARRVRAALDKVGLLNKEKYSPAALSVGEQQRVGIARAVVNKPLLLLADEPTGNLDPNLSAEIMSLFGQFNQVGVSILIASHDVNLITNLRKRVLVLKDGQLVGGNPHE